MNAQHRPHRLACLALALSAASLAAQAQTNRNDGYSLLPYTHKGYVGLNLGQSEFKIGCGIGGYECDKRSDVSAYLYTGGLFNDWFGLELGYLHNGHVTRAGGRTTAQGIDLSAVLRAPIGRFNVFLKGGAIYGQTRVSTGSLSGIPEGKRRGWGGSYGAGVGFDFTPSSGVVLAWDRHEFKFPGLGRENVDTTSVGFVHRF